MPDAAVEQAARSAQAVRATEVDRGITDVAPLLSFLQCKSVQAIC